MFYLPIELYKKHFFIKDCLMSDLELKNFFHAIYDDISYNWMEKYDKTKYMYSTDISFLEETRKLCSKNIEFLSSERVQEITTYYDSLCEFKKCSKKDFMEKNQMIDWEKIEFMNSNPVVMQVLTIYNMFSPVLSVIMPIIFMIMPFIVLKVALRVPISLNAYLEVLQKQLSQNPFGRAILQIGSSDTSINQKMYGIGMLFVYLLNIYNNVMNCIRFYKNIFTVSSFIVNTKHFLQNAYDDINVYLTSLNTYSEPLYTTQCEDLMREIQKTLDEIEHINEFELSWSSCVDIGKRLSILYDFYESSDLLRIVDDACGFYTHMVRTKRIGEHLRKTTMNPASFDKQKREMMKNYTYPYISLIMKEETLNIPNNVTLDRNYMITGPNASGKTTNIKSVLLNTLLTQIWGCGCYEKANIVPYDEFYSSINIPDTCGRDSLFQAEARRCLDVIQEIQSSPEKRFLCIFDELYSGTNPYEAVLSAKAFLHYLEKYNVRFFLTTHYYKLCKIKYNTIKQYRMKTEIGTNHETKYCYTCEKGISKVKGGFEVLRDLGYPTEILQSLV